MLLAFSELVTPLGPGVVGDVGCGPGHISKHLAGLGLAMVGYDVSIAMIEQARKKHPTGEFHVASMLDLPVPDQSWIGAVALLATLHCDQADRAQTLKELQRLVRPGGFVMHSFFVSAPDLYNGRVKWRREGLTGCRADTYFVSIDDAAAEMDTAGFDVMAAWCVSRCRRRASARRCCYMLGKRCGLSYPG
jgi:SAM-dependent methyltransferase